MPLTKDEFLKKMKQQYEELNDRWNIERNKLQDKTQEYFDRGAAKNRKRVG